MLKTLEEKVDPKNAALLVVDMQNDFCHPEGSLARRGRDMTLGLQMAPIASYSVNEVIDATCVHAQRTRQSSC